MRTAIAAFVSRRWRVPPGQLRVEVQSLHGGLESSVTLARISHPADGAVLPRHLVVKQLPATVAREADVYETLWRHLDRPPAVRLFGRDVADGRTYLYLEEARGCSPWPWSEPLLAGAVCRALARLHDAPHLPRDTFSWDYETALAESAASTLDLAARAHHESGRRCWRRLGDLRRVVAARPAIRERLMAGSVTVIHGDVHPNNVILRRRGQSVEVVLIDWARARIGSPLEDVACWLHSLGCWEPQARRRHDTLMRTYLEARRIPQRFNACLRVDYWLASASNGLSGAIRYHLAVAADPAAAASARHDARRAVLAWERVVRKAAALVSTNLRRCT